MGAGAGPQANFLERSGKGSFGLAEERVARNLAERDDRELCAGFFQISHLV